MQVKMKKTIKRVLVLLIILVLGFFIFIIISKTKQKREIASTIQTIPNFSFTKLNNDTFSNENLNENIPTLFINFNSECDYCQIEAQSIKDNVSKLKNIQILFISSEPIEKIKNFGNTYKLMEHKNIILLFDKNDVFSTLFDTNTIPTSLIYNKNQHLIKKHKGQLKAKNIIKEINNSNE